MVVRPVRAVYESGYLRLLEPIDLSEGQEIQLLIVSEQESARVALVDIVRDDANVALDDPLDEAMLLALIDADTAGKPPISDAIILERREGP